MTPELNAKLARLHNRPTRYELVATSPSGERFLAGYCGKSMFRMIDMLRKHGDFWVVKTGSNSFETSHQPRCIKMGGWTFALSGRTQRESYIGGELPFAPQTQAA